MELSWPVLGLEDLKESCVVRMRGKKLLFPVLTAVPSVVPDSPRPCEKAMAALLLLTGPSAPHSTVSPLCCQSEREKKPGALCRGQGEPTPLLANAAKILSTYPLLREII